MVLVIMVTEADMVTDTGTTLRASKAGRRLVPSASANPRILSRSFLV
jgi:hypothetical protein